ncbi:MAG: DUF4384 domain-containing protein [Cyanobacteria bacterium J007]|nr:MAG: DUF4384 domain-containing protein [Cyanobacteria bacterium J007]
MESFRIKLVEAMDIPQEYEAEFLGDLANKLDLKPLTGRIFTERLSRDRLDADWSDIAKSCPPMTPDQARKDAWSREILPKLRDWDFDYERGSKQLWRRARQWLVENQFEPWLWERLKGTAQPTQQMGIKDPRHLSHLGMLPAENYLLEVPLNHEVIFEIQLFQPAHLTLLEREPNGTVVCLCPSPFARKSQFSQQQNRVILPQPNSPRQVFTPNEKGTEQLLAVLTRESPGFDWLEQSRQGAMQLQASHLQEMFEYVTKTTDTDRARLLYTEYEVV